MDSSIQNKRSAVAFYLLVFMLSILFWLFGAFAGFLSKELR
ncbi:hypothetical protein OYT88_05085 [Sporolactobacillus sp. CQH2019]|nr:hypothetical protein [Sporolactobacillus sp. CQH2019]MDD9147921.1 hypothetical protein [Sporolactobacillus sp. CQH2019]